MLTGTLGTPQSAPGAVQPGYFCTGFAEWRGPFPVPASLTVGGAPAGSTTVRVSPATASQMAQSDQNWWVLH